MIPLSIPNLSGNELKYVTEAVADGWISSVGPHVTKFEEAFARYVGSKYAVSCVNGTAALHTALVLCGVEPNDEVIVPNLTFVATLNAVKYCYAHPVIMDSDWKSLGMDTEKVSDFLKKETYYKDGFTFNRTTNRRIKAIMPVHALGYPVDVDALLSALEGRNIDLIEDATESLGSLYKGRMTGLFGKIGCFSFNGNKIMSTGGGGMMVTDHDILGKRAKHLTTTAKTDPVEYDHDEVGYNYRLVNVLAAIGIGQLEQMPSFVETKRKNHALYSELIAPLEGVSLHHEPDYCVSNYWMYSLILAPELGCNARQVVDMFQQRGIQTRPIWKLMTSLPMFRHCQAYYCDTSPDIQRRIVSLPCSTHLTESEIVKVVEALKEILQAQRAIGYNLDLTLE